MDNNTVAGFKINFLGRIYENGKTKSGNNISKIFVPIFEEPKKVCEWHIKKNIFKENHITTEKEMDNIRKSTNEFEIKII